jgi:hypothetical protein
MALLTFNRETRLSGQLHAPATLPAGKEPCTTLQWSFGGTVGMFRRTEKSVGWELNVELLRQRRTSEGRRAAGAAARAVGQS